MQKKTKPMRAATGERPISAPTPAVTEDAHPDPYFSRAVGKALDALEAIGQGARPYTLGEVSTLPGLTKASAFRLLHTLETLGYLSKSDEGRYSAQSRTLRNSQTRMLNGVMRYGPEALERLCMEFRETASLAALFDNHIEVLVVAESQQLVRMGNTTGRIVPPHASSLGKAIAAFQPPETRDRLLRSYGTAALTPATLVDEIALRAEFERIREAGFAEDREESVLGGWCFAAPMLNAAGVAFGAVSLSMPRMRLPEMEQRGEIAMAVKKAAAAVARLCMPDERMGVVA